MREVLGLTMSRVPHETMPEGRYVEVPGRGRAFVIDTGPPSESAGDGPAPTLFLVHGLTITAYLNWYPAFPVLAKRFRVISMDMRGHGRGADAGSRFRLEDCADDAAAVCKALGADRVIPVGYSLGGPVAQLIWRRHPELVSGLVLASTSRNFGGTSHERAFYRTLLGVVATLRVGQRLPVRWGGRGSSDGPDDGSVDALPGDVVDPDEEFADAWWAPWALRELRRGRPESLMLAMNAMGRFSSHSWIHEVDVPAAMVITTRDRAIAPDRQLKLARAIPGCTLHPCPAGHPAAVLAQSRFVPALVEACDSVADRIASMETSARS